MANYSTLKAAVADVVKTNGSQAITGANLQSVLLSIINSIGGGGYIFAGVATPETSVGTPDQNVFYITGAGTFANMGTSTTVPVGSIGVFKYNGSWLNAVIDIAGNYETLTGYYECGTAAGTAAKTVAATGYTLTTGGAIKIKFTNANTNANPTLNINSTGAKPLYYGGALASAENSWVAGETVDVYYDGTNFYANNVEGGGTFATGQKVRDIGIDNVPTAGSKNLVKSGGLQNELALGAVYDVSAKNPTSGPNSDGKWESLSALLSDTNINTLIPTGVRKGGMSIKFVQTSDNKYVQYRLMTTTWSINTTDWSICSDTILIENPEYLQVTTDSEDKILEAIKTDGTKYMGKGVDINGTVVESTDNPEWLQVTTDKEGRILEGIRKNGKKYIADIDLEGVPTKEYVDQHDEEIALTLSERIDEVEAEIPSEISSHFDYSVGNVSAQDSAISQRESSSLTSDVSTYDDAYKTDLVIDEHDSHNQRRLVAINYDDLPQVDYLSTRKLLNKYGFTAQFSYIQRLFTNIEEKRVAITNVKKMIKDGNILFIHALMGQTYSITNTVCDVRPDGKSTFLPSLEELQPIGATGKNELGQNVTDSTTIRNLGFHLAFHDFVVVNGTPSQYDTVWQQYVLWIDDLVQEQVSGLDLHDNLVSKTGYIGWIEYFYNELIDNTLGYSTNEGSILAKFNADYSIPTGGDVNEYYPDATHIKNGKIKRYTDINSTTRYTWYAWRKGKDVVFTLSETPSVGDTIYSDTALTDSGNTVASYANDSIVDSISDTFERFDWCDTINHLDSEGYQSAGYFLRGLFKGCSTTMNIEAVERNFQSCIAYFHYLFGSSKFYGYTPHGTRRIEAFYTDAQYRKFFDRAMAYYCDDSTKVYSTRLGCFRSLYDIFENLGFKSSVNQDYNPNVKYEGMAFLFEGQENVRKTHLYCKKIPIYIDGVYVFPNLYKNDSMTEIISLSQVMDVMGNKDNYGRYMLENAEKTVTGQSGDTYVMSSWLKKNIQAVVESLGTGRIPQLTFDSIGDSDGLKFVMEQLYAFCYNNDLEITSYEKARRSMINTPKRYLANYFPNPSFVQTIREYYSTTSDEFNVPDGLTIINFTDGVSEVSVDDVTINDVVYRQLSMKGCSLGTRIYGLVPGTYKFTCKLKKTGSGNTKIHIEERYGKDLYSMNAIHAGSDLTPTSEWADYDAEVVVNDPFVKHDSSYASAVCKGYQENVCNIYIRLDAASGDVLYITQPELTLE